MVIHTASGISGSALGQEIIADLSDKNRMAFFAASQAVGLVMSVPLKALNFYITIHYATDILARVDFAFRRLVPIGIVLMVPYIFLVKEPPLTSPPGGKSPPLMYAVRSLMRSAPYRNHLFFSLAYSYGYMMHNAVYEQFIAYILHIENIGLFYNIVGLFGTGAGYVSQLYMFRLVQSSLSKQNLAAMHLAAMVCITAVGSIISPDMMKRGFFHFMIVVYTLCTVFVGIVQRVFVADVIKYDRLTIGLNRAGTFVSMDHAIEAVFKVFGEPIPPFVLSAVGFVNNGGCSCGCGAPCSLPYLRWDCPGDIGYACSNDFNDNPPFYGDPSRVPPCTLQPQAVTHTIRWFFFYVTMVFFALAAILVSYFPITPEVSEDLDRQIFRAEAHGKAYDPIFFTEIRRADAERRQITFIMEQFSDAEQRLLVSETMPIAIIVRQNLVVIVLTCVSALLVLWTTFLSHFSVQLMAFRTSILTYLPLASFVLITWHSWKIMITLKDKHVITGQHKQWVERPTLTVPSTRNRQLKLVNQWARKLLALRNGNLRMRMDPS